MVSRRPHLGRGSDYDVMTFAKTGGPIPDWLVNCRVRGAIARDLAVEYTETTIAGTRYVCAFR